MRTSRSPRTKTHQYRNASKFNNSYIDSDELEDSSMMLTYPRGVEYTRDGTDIELLKVQLSECVDEIHSLKARLHHELMEKQVLDVKNKELVEKLLEARQGLQETAAALQEVQRATDILSERKDERDYLLQQALDKVKERDIRISDLEVRMTESEDGTKFQNSVNSYRKIISEKDEIIKTLEEQQFSSQNQLAKRKRENQRLVEEKADLEHTLETKLKKIETLEANNKALEDKVDSLSSKSGIKDALLTQIMLQALPSNLVANMNAAASNIATAAATTTTTAAPEVKPQSVADPPSNAATTTTAPQPQQQSYVQPDSYYPTQQMQTVDMAMIEARLAQLEGQLKATAMAAQSNAPYNYNTLASYGGGSGYSRPASKSGYVTTTGAPVPSNDVYNNNNNINNGTNYNTGNNYSNGANYNNYDSNGYADYNYSNNGTLQSTAGPTATTTAAPSSLAPIVIDASSNGFTTSNGANDTPTNSSSNEAPQSSQGLRRQSSVNGETADGRPMMRRQSSSTSRKTSSRPTLFAAAYSAAQKKSQANLNISVEGSTSGDAPPTNNSSSEGVSAPKIGVENGGWAY